MDIARADSHLPGKRKDQVKELDSAGNQQTGEGDNRNTEVKNAQAAGMGALGRSDENQIEKLIDGEPEKDDNIY